jgi:YVTN family beta-propeller protein
VPEPVAWIDGVLAEELPAPHPNHSRRRLESRLRLLYHSRLNRLNFLLKTGGLTILTSWAVCAATGQTADRPVRAVADPGVVTTRQTITPAGVQSVFEGRVHGVVFSPSSDQIYAVTASPSGGTLYKLDWQTNAVAQLIRTRARPGMQGLALDPASDEPLMTGIESSAVGGQAVSAVELLSMAGGSPKVITDHLGVNAVGGIAIAAEKNQSGHRYAVVPLTFNDEVGVIDLATGKAEGKIKTGIAPFGVAIDRGSTVAYVSNWGGRVPTGSDMTARTGDDSDADRVVVDERGIASTGTVTRVDLSAMRATATISVGLHPTALHWDQKRSRLYVANSNADSVSVIDTRSNSVIQSLPLQPFDRRVAGVAPNALTVDSEGRNLYVACGGINAVVVVRVSDGQILGLIPTAWYPNHIAISKDDKHLAVSTMLGVGSGWNSEAVKQIMKSDGLQPSIAPNHRYVHAYRGSVHVIPVPEEAQLSGYTTAVAENNHLRLRGNERATIPTSRREGPLAVPLRAGDPSLIQHVVYIVKENRSYDQVLGDLTKGNGDPSLLVYGPDTTPNAHRLADQFVLLDNFYATGGNSGDGHQWVTQGSETDYCYWPGYSGRSYPKNGNDPLAYASSGFIWDAALAQKKTVEIFGEYVGNMLDVKLDRRPALLQEYKDGNDFAGRFKTVAPIQPLNNILAEDFPAYGLQCPDVVRARIFLTHLRQWEQAGRMPNLSIIQLPSDHTAGTLPGFSTSRACVADNDLALGQIVEGLSKSRFWSKMAIFVVEDDAQTGIDHVDGHRTVALAISPYIRKGSVDSTFYSQPSMLKTMELMLGLPTLSLFDLIANDMRNSFQQTPDLTPYTSETPKQSIYDLNPKVQSLQGTARRAALASMRMNFMVPDAAPVEELNRILWHDAKGWNRPYPGVVQGVFAPYSIDQEDYVQEKSEPAARPAPRARRKHSSRRM